MVLLKSVLSCFPIYFLSLFVIPPLVKRKIDKIQQSFLWQDEEGRKKIHQMRWSEVCKLVNQRRLKVRPIGSINKSLLSK